MTEKSITQDGSSVNKSGNENQFATGSIGPESITASSSDMSDTSENTMIEKAVVEKIIAEKIHSEICQKCGKELHGDLGVSDMETPYGWIILVGETSPRNWICCDSCSTVVCHSCCTYPFSGYCDDCVRKYDLDSWIEEKYGT